jgi:hypothetical protein
MGQAERKITVLVPEELLERAQKSTGQGITETIRQGGLRLVAAGETFRRVAGLRGSVKFRSSKGRPARTSTSRSPRSITSISCSPRSC